MRKLPGTHKFLYQLVCDRCGFKVSYDRKGRSAMRDHLEVHAERPAGGAS